VERDLPSRLTAYGAKGYGVELGCSALFVLAVVQAKCGGSSPFDSAQGQNDNLFASTLKAT